MPAFQRILVPVDGSEPSDRALATALQMARESGGQVRVVHCFDDLVYLTGFEASGDVLMQARAQAQQVLEQARARAVAAGVACDAKLIDVPGRRLGDDVAREALDWNADLVVVGSHGRRGLDRLLLGSGAEQVVRLAPVPVLVVRDKRSS